MRRLGPRALVTAALLGIALALGWVVRQPTSTESSAASGPRAAPTPKATGSATRPPVVASASAAALGTITANAPIPHASTAWRITGTVVRGGEAAPHARVRVASGNTGASGSSTVADAAGRFGFALPQGSWARLEALHDQAWRGSVDVERPASGDVRIELERGAAVRVRVVDVEGEPIAGARVEAGIVRHPASAGPPVDLPPLHRLRAGPALTDREGWAALTVLLAGEYQVEALHDARGVVVELHAIDLAPTTARELLLTIRGGAAIEGRVTSPDGLARAGQRLVLSAAVGSSWFGNRSAVTDADGRYRIGGVEPGPYRLRFMPSPCSEPERTVDMPAGHDLRLDLVALPRGLITGTVLDEDNVPLPGVGVLGLVPGGSFAHTRATSDASGRFALEACADDRYSVDLHWPEDASARARTSGPIMAAMGQDVVLRVGPAATLAVDLVFAGGPPPGSYTYQVQSSGGASTEPHFTVGGLSAGRWPLLIEAPGYQSLGTTVTLEAGETTRVPLTLRRGSTLRGRVVDAMTRTGLAGVPVEATSEDGYRLAVTDGEGRFVLDGLAEVSYTLVARGRALDRGHVDEKVGPVDVGPASPPIEVELTRGTTVRGRVRAGGRPVAGAEVILERHWNGVSAIGESRHDGTFTLKGLGPGTHEWSVRVGTGNTVRKRDGRVVLPEAGEHDLDVELDAAGGRVVVVTPAEREMLFLELFTGHVAPPATQSGLWSELTTGHQRVAFEGLWTGEYTLVARAPDAQGRLVDAYVQALVIASPDAVVEVVVPR